MNTEFILLNKNWNAEPNAPDEKIGVINDYLSLSFLLNPWAYKGYDEAWYSGQCCFSHLAPAWREFYTQYEI